MNEFAKRPALFYATYQYDVNTNFNMLLLVVEFVLKMERTASKK
jgi:hypothetical protein